MVGVLPSTKLLVTLNDYVVDHFSSYREVGQLLKVTVDDAGTITMLGKPQSPSYKIKTCEKLPKLWDEGFTQEEAITDWCRCYLVKNLPASYNVYRFLAG